MSKKLRISNPLRRLSIKDQEFFTRRLSFLLRSGVSLLEALQMIHEQTNSKRYSSTLDLVAKDVSNGHSLAQSLSRQQGVFSDFAISIIAVGEESGTLSSNLCYLADELKKRQILRKKILGALIYPIFITIATLGITALLTVYIFPQIMPIFTSLSIELPMTTRMVLYTSSFLKQWGVLLVTLILILLTTNLVIIRKNRRIHLLYDSIVLKLPFMGNMIRNYNLANVSRTLSLLLKGGLTLSESLPITAKTTQNLVYRNEFEKLSLHVNSGERISTHMKSKSKIFPEVLAQIVSVGERSGNLSETLGYLSELYENEVDESTKNLSSMIEPVLMIFMGVLVGFIAIAVITPIYGITEHLSNK